MNDIDKLLQEVYNKWGADTVKAIIKEIDRQGLRHLGILRRSISYEQKGENEPSFNMVDYGTFLDEGVESMDSDTNTGYKFRGNWKGMAYHLTEWADSKDLNRFAVAYSIQKKGLKPRKFFNSVIEKRFPILMDEVNEALIKSMDQTIDNLD